MAMPNHQPFEEWLISEDDLTPEQAQALREHLSACQHCQALEASLKGVSQLFESIPDAAPAPGFTARWQNRLAEEHRRQQTRLSWLLMAISGGAALALLGFITVQAFDLLRSPDQLILLFMYRMISLIAYLRVAEDLFAGLFQNGLVVLLALVIAAAGIFSLIAFLGSLWIVIYRQLTSPRRIKL